MVVVIGTAVVEVECDVQEEGSWMNLDVSEKACESCLNLGMGSVSFSCSSYYWAGGSWRFNRFLFFEGF